MTNAVLINWTINTLSNLEVYSLDFDLWASNSENSIYNNSNYYL